MILFINMVVHIIFVKLQREYAEAQNHLKRTQERLHRLDEKHHLLLKTAQRENAASEALITMLNAQHESEKEQLTLQLHSTSERVEQLERQLNISQYTKSSVPFFNLGIIKRIKNLDLSQAPFLQLSRDLFLFSLYTRGMSFIDMAWLKKDNLQSGHLIYRRHKTGQQLSIKWESCMKELVKKYEGLAKHYLLPIIVNDGDERGQYKRMQYRVNHALKRVSEMAGIAPALTMYVARHSWASIAKSKHIPTAIISEGMGHDSEQTTRIYLASLDTSVVDKANKKILDLL